MMEVEQKLTHLRATDVFAAILQEFSAITDYRTLLNTLPGRMAHLLQCRCMLLYQRTGETLQFAAGTFDDKPGWSVSLLAVAHINPIDLQGNTLEAQAWRSRHAVTSPINSSHSAFVAVPLIYRQRAIGVLVAIRGDGVQTQPLVLNETSQGAMTWGLDEWSGDEVQVLEVAANIVAMLLENTRLLERDRDRIRELSLLNSISSQMNSSMHSLERLHTIVIQRTKEIADADTCGLLLPTTPMDNLSWISPTLQEMLLHHFVGQNDGNTSPFILERPGKEEFAAYLDQLPQSIKTFFAIPLLSREKGSRYTTLYRPSDRNANQILGVIVGAFHRPWKLRREELILLQVLANQAGAVLENISLMEAVIEARNEARKLLRQVLDDQKLKQLILESIPSGLITIDLDGTITTFNRAAYEISGYHPYEVAGQPLQKFLPVDSLDIVLQQSKVQSQTVLTVDRKGQEIILDVTLLPLRDDRAKQIGALATFTDVTTMHRLEEEKRRLDRLASLGEMAANVAHEVRNPLASIKTSVQMLLDDLSSDDAGEQERETSEDYFNSPSYVQESISVVLQEVERLDAIVHDLLLFSRPRQLHRVECNIAELIERVLQVIQPQCLEAGIVIHRIYSEVPPVKVDMAQMEQVLMNLVLNAVHAMPDGGLLTVSSQVVHTITGDSIGAAEPILPEVPINEPQGWLEVSVSDTGKGIAPDELTRIFQPFFTTKAHGIGLGLPITRRLIEDHRGSILVQSQLGYGATFIVRLPLEGNL
jgi:PAS domain S-box-containing protein